MSLKMLGTEGRKTWAVDEDCSLEDLVPLFLLRLLSCPPQEESPIHSVWSFWSEAHMGSSGTTGKKGPSSTLCGLLLALLKQFSLQALKQTSRQPEIQRLESTCILTEWISQGGDWEFLVLTGFPRWYWHCTKFQYQCKNSLWSTYSPRLITQEETCNGLCVSHGISHQWNCSLCLE